MKAIPEPPTDRISLLISQKYTPEMGQAGAALHPCELCREAIALSPGSKTALAGNPMLVALCAECAVKLNPQRQVTGIMPGTEDTMHELFGDQADLLSHVLPHLSVRQATGGES